MDNKIFRGRVVQRVRRFPEEYHDFGWVYGDLHHSYNGSFFTHITNIDEEEMETKTYDVVAHSVSQSTGLKDKNGKLIFEGDIVKHKFRRIWRTEEHTSVVVWCQDYCCYYLFDGVSNHRMREDMVYEVIGNTYENKDMIPKKKTGDNYVVWSSDKNLPF